jgi:hypothetical protein
MKTKLVGCCLLGLALILTLSISARPDRDDRDRHDRDDERGRSENHKHNVNTPVGFVEVIPIPGNPVVSTDLSWTDPGTERFYLADRSNSAVDIVDAEKDVFVGRVTGFVGATGANGVGPDGVLVTPDHRLFAGDGNSKMQVADVDPNSSNYLKFLFPSVGCTVNCGVNTADPTFAGGQQCNNGTTNTCGRADELGYDPADHIVMVANDAPTPQLPATVAWPYATFVSTDTYKILGEVIFTGAGGAEQPVWDAAIQRFLITLPGTALQAPEVAIIDPKNLGLGIVNHYSFPCATLPGGTGTGANGAALGAFQHLLISACGEPVIVDALTGAVLHVIRDVGGGDEVWYNPGDGRFYVTSTDNTVVVPAGGTAPTVLGVIDAEDSSWLQNVPDTGGRNPSAFPENNRIFTPVRTTAAFVSAPATDNTICASFGLKGTGCVAVFTHKGGLGD